MRLRNLLSTAALDPATLSALITTARRTRTETGSSHRPLAGRTLCMAFLAESARTLPLSSCTPYGLAPNGKQPTALVAAIPVSS